MYVSSHTGHLHHAAQPRIFLTCIQPVINMSKIIDTYVLEYAMLFR